MSSETVEYRDIPGFPGYRVGSDGTVWSCRTHTVVNGRSVPATCDRWKKLKPYKTTAHGYLAVSLMRDARRVSRKVYHLVLEAFVGPRPDGCCGCHNDGDVANNSLSNLRWDTVKNNHGDKRKHGTVLRGEEIHSAKISERTAMEIKLLLREGLLPSKIARRLGITPGIVQKIKGGTHWKHVKI